MESNLDDASINALLEEFQRVDSGELMIDSVFSNDGGVGRVDDNSFPGFTAEEQRTIMEKFTLYQAQHAQTASSSVENQNLQDSNVNKVVPAQPTLFQMGNHMHQASVPGALAATLPLQPSSLLQRPSIPTFESLQGRGSLSRLNLEEGRLSAESSQVSLASQSKRRQLSDDGGMSFGRYSVSAISPENSYRDPANGPIMPSRSLAVLASMTRDGDEGDMDDEKKREKNRLAQRKFRDKQKNQVSTLQSQLDAKNAQLMTAFTLIRDLTTKLQLYQSTFGPLPSPTQTSQPPPLPHS